MDGVILLFGNLFKSNYCVSPMYLFDRLPVLADVTFTLYKKSSLDGLPMRQALLLVEEDPQLFNYFRSILSRKSSNPTGA